MAWYTMLATRRNEIAENIVVFFLLLWVSFWYKWPGAYWLNQRICILKLWQHPDAKSDPLCSNQGAVRSSREEFVVLPFPSSRATLHACPVSLHFLHLQSSRISCFSNCIALNVKISVSLSYIRELAIIFKAYLDYSGCFLHFRSLLFFLCYLFFTW